MSLFNVAFHPGETNHVTHDYQEEEQDGKQAIPRAHR